MFSTETFDILYDLKLEPVSKAVFTVFIPDKYVGRRLRGFIYDLSAQLTFSVPYPSLIEPTLPYPPDLKATSARRPWNDLRVRLSDKISDSYTSKKNQSPILAIAGGDTKYLSDQCILADYRLSEGHLLYPPSFELQDGQFNFQIEQSAIEGDLINYANSLPTFLDDIKSGKLWFPKTFIIRFRFVILD